MTISDLHDLPWGTIRGPASMRSPVRLLVLAGLRWWRAGGPQLGAAVAFYMALAMAPLAVAAIAAAGALLGPDAVSGHVAAATKGLIGSGAAAGIETLIESSWRHPDGLLAGVLGVAGLLIGALGVFAQLRRALNVIGRVPSAPLVLGTVLRARMRAFALVLGFGFLAIASLLLSALLVAVGSYLNGLMPGLADLFALLDVALSTGLLAFAFAALLRWVPDLPWSARAAWCGGLCSALLFSIGKQLIGLYLARAGVASSFGAAGVFAMLLLWLYGTAQILLYGGSLAAAVDDDRVTPGRSAHPPPLRSPAPLATEASAAPTSPAQPTSLAAVRSRLAPGALAARHRTSTSQTQPAVLLRFPDHHHPHRAGPK